MLECNPSAIVNKIVTVVVQGLRQGYPHDKELRVAETTDRIIVGKYN
jgi:hypothetical protein